MVSDPKGRSALILWMTNTHVQLERCRTLFEETPSTHRPLRPLGRKDRCGIILEIKAQPLGLYLVKHSPKGPPQCVECSAVWPFIGVRVHDGVWLVHRLSRNTSSLDAPLYCVNIFPSAYVISHDVHVSAPCKQTRIMVLLRVHDSVWLVHRLSINTSSLDAPLYFVNIFPSA